MLRESLSKNVATEQSLEKCQHHTENNANSYHLDFKEKVLKIMDYLWQGKNTFKKDI